MLCPCFTPVKSLHGYLGEMSSLSLANCYFTHDSLEFPVLLRFCDAQSGCSPQKLCKEFLTHTTTPKGWPLLFSHFIALARLLPAN